MPCFEYPFRPPQIAAARGEDPLSHAVELEEENMRAAEDAWNCGVANPPSFQGQISYVDDNFIICSTPGQNVSSWVTDEVTFDSGTGTFTVLRAGIWRVHAAVLFVPPTNDIYALYGEDGLGYPHLLDSERYTGAGSTGLGGSTLIALEAGAVLNPNLTRGSGVAIDISAGNIQGNYGANWISALPTFQVVL